MSEEAPVTRQSIERLRDQIDNIRDRVADGQDHNAEGLARIEKAVGRLAEGVAQGHFDRQHIAAELVEIRRDLGEQRDRLGKLEIAANDAKGAAEMAVSAARAGVVATVGAANLVGEEVKQAARQSASAPKLTAAKVWETAQAKGAQIGIIIAALAGFITALAGAFDAAKP